MAENGSKKLAQSGSGKMVNVAIPQELHADLVTISTFLPKRFPRVRDAVALPLAKFRDRELPKALKRAKAQYAVPAEPVLAA